MAVANENDNNSNHILPGSPTLVHMCLVIRAEVYVNSC